MTDQPAGPLHADALEANRAGRLTDAQRADWKSFDRGWRKNELIAAVICAVLGVLLLVAAGKGSDLVPRLLLGIAFLVGAGAFVIRGVLNLDPLAADLRAGRVENVEGAVAKTRSYAGGRTVNELYHVDVEGKRFVVHQKTYEAVPDAGIIRLFYLPRSRKVVNVEQLPDRPVAPGALEALTSPMSALRMTASAFAAPNTKQRAEMMANVAALGHALQAEMGPTDATPPPPDQRDQRPLAEAILGTWRMGPMTVTFSADGTATMDAAGMARKGPWSVGGDGRLHSAALGPDGAADAWITGDTLTVSTDGRSMAFHRVPAG